MSTIDTLEAGRELDALVAEKVMGIPVVWQVPPYMEPGKPFDPCWGRLPYLKGTANGRTYDWETVPDYSGSIAAAFEMEAEIERQGLAREYVRALSVIAGIANYANMHQRYWLLTHATACQRCAAALQVIDDPAAERRMQYREAEIDRGLKLGKKAAEISEREKGGCEPQQ